MLRASNLELLHKLHSAVARQTRPVPSATRDVGPIRLADAEATTVGWCVVILVYRAAYLAKL